MSAPRVRIAPSPTGYFHVGTAWVALFNWLYARRHGGTFILRIEDTDVERNLDEAVEGIQRALRWLGLDWDEGPYFQSQRGELYRAAAERLYREGQAYYCDCTPEQVRARAEAAKRPPGYDGYCRDRGLGPGPGRVLRFRTPDEGEVTVMDVVVEKPPTTRCSSIEDFALVKSNGAPLFMLANVVDDIDMRITHVIRGNDHLTNTNKYILLWEALGGGDLPVFAHLPMLVDESRKKLSKRKHKVALEDYRDEGYLPEAMRNYLALLGWSPAGDREIVTLDEMVRAFALEDIGSSPAFFDEKKLAHINGEYIRMLSPQQFVARTEEWFHDRFLLPMAEAVQTRAATLADAMGAVDFFVSEPVRYDPPSWDKAMGTPEALAILDRAIAAYDALADDQWTAEVLHQTTAAVAEDLGARLNKAQAPVRVAITGRSVGPPLFESMVVLGRARTMSRLRAARDRCASR